MDRTEPTRQPPDSQGEPVPGFPPPPAGRLPRARSGPKTSKGKAAVARNATTHGIFAKTPIIPGVESLEEWEAHLAGVLSSIDPQDYLQAELARDAANQLWHLKRVDRWEAALLAMEQAKVESELASLLTERAQQLGIPNPRGWKNEEQLEEEILLLRTRQIPLDRLGDQADRTPFPLGAAQDLVRTLLAMEGVDPADAPKAVRALLRSTEHSISAAVLLKAVRRLATAVGEKAPTMLRRLADGARAREASLRELKAWASHRRQLLKDVHLLPAAEVADRFMKYRSHFTRQFQQDVHELEALQARQRGEPTPLARIDVQGIPQDLSALCDAVRSSSKRSGGPGADPAGALAEGRSTVVPE